MKKIRSRQLEVVQYERHRARTAVFQKVIKDPRPRPRARLDDFTILIGDSSSSAAAMLLGRRASLSPRSPDHFLWVMAPTGTSMPSTAIGKPRMRKEREVLWTGEMFL